MGMIVGLFFAIGAAANIPLIIAGIAMHAAISKVTGRKGNWLVYLLSSLGFTVLYAIIVYNMFMPGGSSSQAAENLMFGAALIGASPGVGFVLAAFVLRQKETGSLSREEDGDAEPEQSKRET
jgi:Na+(H+)/acetate symporter ActP